MACHRTPYLFRRGGIFYFRFAVPFDLRSWLSRIEWRCSLRTRQPAPARLLARQLACAIEQIIRAIRQMPTLTSEAVNDLVRAAFEDILSKYNETAFIGPDDPQLDLDHEIEGTEKTIVGLRRRLRDHDYSARIKTLADELLAEHGIERPKENSEELDLLRHGLLRADLEASRIYAARLRGHFEDLEPKDPLFKGTDLERMPPMPGTAKPKAISKPDLGELVRRYIEHKSIHLWVDKTLKDNERVLGWLLELESPKTPIDAMGLDDIRTFRDMLRDMPAHDTSHKAFKGRSFAEMVQLARGNKEIVRISQATAAKYFSNTKAFFKWCVDEGHLDVTPVRGLTLSPPRDAKDNRYPFTQKQLLALFSSPQYTGHHSDGRRAKPGSQIIRDGKFWIPLIGLYTGMRLGEIVQLLLTDVKQADGIWYFDISKAENPKEGPKKRLKTFSSARVIPVHPELLRFGLVSYMERVSKTKADRLFPEIQAGSDGYYSHNYSKYFGRYLSHISIKTAKTTFHSLRHNFADACDAANINPAFKKALLGHADPSVTGIYGSKPPITLLFNAIRQIHYGLNLNLLYSADGLE